MNAQHVISLEGVAYSYHRRQPVVEAVSCNATAGRLHVLIGPNGCGKTTLLKLMLGEYRPALGGILMEDRPVHGLPAAERAAWVSYVPQRTSQAFPFTVEQVVRMARYALPPDDGAVAQAMGDCDLMDLRDKPLLELSVGQQQRVLLARAIAQSRGRGRLMLLDEPTSAMDLLHAHQAMTLLRQQASRGLALVVVLQDLNLAARYADDVWLMRGGRLVAAGPWDAVLQPPVLEPVYGVQVEVIGRVCDRPVFSTGLRVDGSQGYNRTP